MKKMINNERVEGRVYQHNLVLKTVQNAASPNHGKEFISGTVDVATDEAGLNIVPVHFTYVVEVTNNGNTNATYANLKKIIDGGKTWIADGKDAAMKVRIDTALALNDFYNNNDELISTKVNEGGFVTILNGELAPEAERNTFSTDMVITSTMRVEADPEKNIDQDYVKVKGAVFNFRNDLLPVEFIVRTNEGMAYFEDLGASQNEPVFTKVWGKITCNSIKNEVKEETAFGEEAVRTYERKVKEWLITGTSKVPYDFGEEGVLTVEELKKAAQDRELRTADIKKRRDEYNASKGTPATATPGAAIPTAPASTTVTATSTKTFNF